MEFCAHARAIAKREWSAYFHSPVAYVFIVIFLALAGFFTFSVGGFYEAGQADLRGFFFWHPWLYLILVPAVAMRLWAEERRQGTLELLFTSATTPMQAIAGKMAAAWVVDGVAAFGFMPHYEAMQRGVLDLRDFLYFGSATGFMLFLTQLVLANRTGR